MKTVSLIVAWCVLLLYTAGLVMLVPYAGMQIANVGIAINMASLLALIAILVGLHWPYSLLLVRAGTALSMLWVLYGVVVLWMIFFGFGGPIGERRLMAMLSIGVVLVFFVPGGLWFMCLRKRSALPISTDAT